MNIILNCRLIHYYIEQRFYCTTNAKSPTNSLSSRAQLAERIKARMRQIPSSSIDDKPRERLFVAENPNEAEERVAERVRSGRRQNETDRTKRRPLFSEIYLSCCNFYFWKKLIYLSYFSIINHSTIVCDWNYYVVYCDYTISAMGLWSERFAKNDMGQFCW